VGTHDFPAFYSRTSGLRLEHAVADATEAAQVARARFETLGQGGLLLALPPPQETSLERDDVERDLVLALDAARRQGIHGKAVTPFLLKALADFSGGRSLTANLALLVNNARFAGALAVAYAGAR
jgi:pseudouridine-5'-phosphate glycosidase